MERKHNSLMFISFLAFYIILFAERVTSIVMTAIDPEGKGYGVKFMFFGQTYYKFVYGMTILALIASFILFLRIVGKAMSYGISGSSFVLILNVGALLVAAMMETVYSQIIVQFIAYIILYVGCLTKFIDIMHKKDARGSTIASFVYFVAFGMAIPVIHHVTGASDLRGVKFYYMFEAIAACGLALVFMIMMLFVFSEERYRHVNNIIFFVLLVAADALVLVQGFSIGAPNYFMAGALAVAAIAYLVTGILLLKDKKAKLL